MSDRLDDLKRWRFGLIDSGGLRMFAWPDGEYVLFCDAKALLDERDRELAEMEKEVTTLLDDYNRDFMRPLIAEKDKEIAALKEKVREVRSILWMGHGHTSLYGDDGEMQCGECLPFWDYKRTEISELTKHVLAALTNRVSAFAEIERQRDAEICDNHQVIDRLTRQLSEAQAALEPIREVWKQWKDSNIGFCTYKEGQAEHLLYQFWNAIKKAVGKEGK